jgi:2-polyprenyl-6-methoxyphenol hydroxylase-like FAD-dependent oxidoreductase
MERKRAKKVAIVGSGMAGLVTAYLLARDKKQRYAVTVFEKVQLTQMFGFCAKCSLINLGRNFLARRCIRVYSIAVLGERF